MQKRGSARLFEALRMLTGVVPDHTAADLKIRTSTGDSHFTTRVALMSCRGAGGPKSISAGYYPMAGNFSGAVE